MSGPTIRVPVQDTDTGRYRREAVEMMVAYTSSPLCITQKHGSTALMTIAHRPTGMCLPVYHDDQGELTQLLDELAMLGTWPQTQQELRSMPTFCSLVQETIDSWKDTYQGGAA